MLQTRRLLKMVQTEQPDKADVEKQQKIKGCGSIKSGSEAEG